MPPFSRRCVVVSAQNDARYNARMRPALYGTVCGCVLTLATAASAQTVTAIRVRDRASLVFEAVTREVGLLCDADLARMERYEPDGTVTGVAAWSRVPAELAVGTRIDLDGLSIARGVAQTGGAGAGGQLRRR